MHRLVLRTGNKQTSVVTSEPVRSGSELCHTVGIMTANWLAGLQPGSSAQKMRPQKGIGRNEMNSELNGA